MASMIKCVFLTLISILVLLTGPVSCEGDDSKSLTSGPTNNTSIYIGGMVFCKSCKFWGYVSSMDASPLSGALVRVTCYYTSRRPVTVVATTGASGYFLVRWPNVVNFSTRKCRAYLSYSPFTFCNLQIYPKYQTSAPMKLVSVQNATRGDQAFYSPGVLLYGPSSSNKLCSLKP